MGRRLVLLSLHPAQAAAETANRPQGWLVFSACVPLPYVWGGGGGVKVKPKGTPQVFLGEG